MGFFRRRLTRFLRKKGTIRAHIVNHLHWRTRGLWHVGNDIYGNNYYLYQPIIETPIRRLCLFDGILMTNLDNLPFLWYQWLRYQRYHPPTEDELNEYDNYIKQIKIDAHNFYKNDDLERNKNKSYTDKHKKRMDDLRQETMDKTQKNVVELFESREKALRVAAENKLKAIHEAEEITKHHQQIQMEIHHAKMKLQWERDQQEFYQNKQEANEELNRIYNQQGFNDEEQQSLLNNDINDDDNQIPSATEEEPFKPMGWRPYKYIYNESINENNIENNDKNNETNNK